MPCVLSRDRACFSLALKVNHQHIQHSLIWAPIYACLIVFGILYIVVIMTSHFSVQGTQEILVIFSIYSAVILVSYYVLTCVFIYMTQLWLLKHNRLNFWWIMLSAIALSGIFSLIILLLSTELKQMVVLIPIMAMPIALCYWLLLLRHHQKNSQHQR